MIILVSPLMIMGCGMKNRDNLKAREEIISRVEAGVYSRKGLAPEIILGLFVSLIFLAILLPLTIASLRGGNVAEAIVFAFMSLVIVLVTSERTLGEIFAKTRKLSSKTKELILHGERIEAGIDSILENNKTWTIVCSAEYRGIEYKFKSKKSYSKFMPIEDRKIFVFIDPQNPKRYFVNIYDYLPIYASKALVNKSEMRREKRKDDEDGGDSMRDANGRIYPIAIVVIGFFIATMILLIVDVIFVLIRSMISTMYIKDFLVIFVFIFVIAFIIVVFASAKKDRQEDILAKGYYIYATIESVEESNDSDSSFRFGINARYLEPETNIVHEFYDCSNDSSARSLVGTKVKVYINPRDMTEYEMCIDEAIASMGFSSSNEK